jgi:hypothetical protein
MPVFISHSHKDEAVYSALCLALDSAGIRRWDVSAMSLGDSLSGQLRRAINECGQCVFIATRRSIESQWCLAELGAFWGAGKTVIMFLADPDLEEAVLPPQLRGNLTANDARRLITALKEAEQITALKEAEQSAITSFSSDNHCEFFAASGDYGTESDWFRLLDDTNETFDVLGVALNSWRRAKDFATKVRAKAKTGCKVRFLSMHPSNKLLQGLIYSEKDYASVVHDIEESSKYYQHLTNMDNIEFRQMHTGMPHFFLTRTDSCAVVIQYLSSQTWGSGPTWRSLAGSDFYKIAMDEFEALWESAKPPAPLSPSTPDYPRY